MAVSITDNEVTAARRRIPLLIFASNDGAAWAGSVTGVKAQLSVNGSGEVASTADLVRVAGIHHYVELTQAEANRTPGDLIGARVAPAAGRLETISYAEITPDDSFAPSMTATGIAIATRDELFSVRGGQQTQPAGGTTQTLTVTDMPSATVIGYVRRYFDSAGKFVGQTELTAS